MSRYDRQSFLGADSDARLARVTIGIVGLGGGGSHVIQQLAHIGIAGIVAVDPDIIEASNLNRLIGGTLDDVAACRAKADIAARMVRNLVDRPQLRALRCKWQDATAALAECDIIIGGVDSFAERAELEAFCRRLLIPYIDMGMDVHAVGEHFSIGGQVVLSMPGCACLWCLGILTEARLEAEAQTYGAAGGKPQVVWPNGVLASLAVGLTMQLLTPWLKHPLGSAYLEYDGNRQQVATSNRLHAIGDTPCRHYRGDETGDPLFDIRNCQAAAVGPQSNEVDAAPASWWRRVLRWLGLL